MLQHISIWEHGSFLLIRPEFTITFPPETTISPIAIKRAESSFNRFNSNISFSAPILKPFNLGQFGSLMMVELDQSLCFISFRDATVIFPAQTGRAATTVKLIRMTSKQLPKILPVNGQNVVVRSFIASIRESHSDLFSLGEGKLVRRCLCDRAVQPSFRFEYRISIARQNLRQ